MDVRKRGDYEDHERGSGKVVNFGCSTAATREA